MKKVFYLSALLLTSAITITSCSDDNDKSGTIIEPPTYGYYAYVAGAGNWGANDGTVGALTINSNNHQFSYSDIYTAANSKGIGDAQDIALYDGKLIVTSTTSSKVEILESNGKLLKTISMTNKSPRYVTAYNHHAYFSGYSGYVYKLNLDTYKLVDSVKVGGYPEALAIANGKLYVNLSDYNYDNSGKQVAVVSLSNFKKEATPKYSDVELNPYNQMLSDNQNVYFVSAYHSEDAMVQCINANNDQLTKNVCKASAIDYDYNNGSPSLVCLYAPYYAKEKRFFRYNINTKTETQLADISSLTGVSEVNVDPTTGNIFLIYTPSYTSPTLVNIYDRQGNLLQQGLSIGYSAQNIRFAN